MEKYYLKTNSGRYKYAGYSTPNMPDGLYFHQKQKYGSRTTSIAYWTGMPEKEPVDLPVLIQILKNDHKVAAHIMALQNEDSDEFKKVKEANSYIKGPLVVANWSAQDLAVEILRFLYKEVVKDEQ